MDENKERAFTHHRTLVHPQTSVNAAKKSRILKNDFEATYFQPNRNLKEGLAGSKSTLCGGWEISSHWGFGRHAEVGDRVDRLGTLPRGVGGKSEERLAAIRRVPRNSVHFKAC